MENIESLASGEEVASIVPEDGYKEEALTTLVDKPEWTAFFHEGRRRGERASRRERNDGDAWRSGGPSMRGASERHTGVAKNRKIDDLHPRAKERSLRKGGQTTHPHIHGDPYKEKDDALLTSLANAITVSEVTEYESAPDLFEPVPPDGHNAKIRPDETVYTYRASNHEDLWRGSGTVPEHLKHVGANPEDVLSKDRRFKSRGGKRGERTRITA